MNKLYCLIGPSSAGKDSIKYASGLPYVVSYRTRKKRKGEIEGRDGYFISRDEFNDKHDKWIAKTDYGGNLYGITMEEIKQLGKSSMIYVIDWDGFLYMKNKFKELNMINEVVSIYIDVDPRDLRNRMVKQERSEIEIQQRLKRLHLDLKVKHKCDYIINNKGSLEYAVEQLFNVIDENCTCTRSI
ncbi:guanylate kinase [Virgibacillus salexigens]|uniref:Guanylate kinase n=1 Tax=Virgibacillus massiliensis TaxID=1462526 RepID=A0A024QGW6_9BACI|nr:guanylate kinase [Virgibacillus massiliensis]CDQ41749.1 Guanylate kinase [Virgibacillus massiliensis]